MQASFFPGFFRAPGLWAAGLLAGLASCGLQKDVDVPLPSYSSELVVECYLVPDSIPRLAVTESLPYLSNTVLSVPTDVAVELTLASGRVVPLPFAPLIDSVAQKVYTHQGREPLLARHGDTFRLDVRDKKGRHVTGTATMTAYVPIDSVRYIYNNKTGDDRKAYFLTHFTDPGATADFYRLTLHKGPNLNRSPESNANLPDRLTNGQSIAIGTGFDFSPGDTVTSTLYHIDEPFYQFRQSTRDARQANGNPFAQPSAVYSTVQGGVGVFTILNFTRRTVVLK